jgi:hypothetical protein
MKTESLRPLRHSLNSTPGYCHAGRLVLFAIAVHALLVTACNKGPEPLLGVWQYTQNTKVIWVFTANHRFMKWDEVDATYCVQGQFKGRGSSLDMFEQREIGGNPPTQNMQVLLEPDHLSAQFLSDTDLKLTNVISAESGLFKRLNGAKSPSSNLAGVWVSELGTPLTNRFIQRVEKGANESGSDVVASALPETEQLDLRPDGTWTLAAFPLSEKKPLPNGPLPVWWLENGQLRLFIGWPPKVYMELPVRYERDGRVFLGIKGPYRRK